MRSILPGSWLNAIAGSLTRHPRFQVLIWNPNEVLVNQIADGTLNRPGIDITHFVTNVDYNDNNGFENGDDPSLTSITLTLNRNPGRGLNLRRGLVEDGVIVQLREGDARIRVEDWIPTFTGTFRGRPGDDPGTPANRSEGMTATAYGREERYQNRMVTTGAYRLDPDADPPVTSIDLGEIAASIANKHMGLGQNEILIGNQGVVTRHITNQIVETRALEALYQCLMPCGKKPKFDALGRLVAVDVNLFKAPARIFTNRDYLVKRKVASPNDVEVNNSVVLKGQSHIKAKVLQPDQMLVDLPVVTGFFDFEYEEDIYYSNDHSQKAEETHLRTKHKIIWASAEWEQIDEFHGELSIDTHYLAAARIIIFILWLSNEIAIAVLTYINDILASLVEVEAVAVISVLLTIAKIIALVTLAALLWAMQFVGRGRYQIWGRPYEWVYPEISVQRQIAGLLPEEVREREFRNDFISDKDSLFARAKELLRRELVKDQLFEIEIMNDFLLESDDVLETANGDRFYILTVRKSLSARGENVMTLVCWKVQDGALLAVDAGAIVSTEADL